VNRIWSILIVLVVCLAIGSCGSAPTPEPVLPAIRDSQVVPGVRIGPLSVGMTASQLLEVMGAPNSENTTNYGHQYWWNDLSATVYARDGLVHWVSDNSQGRYRLNNGIRQNSTLLEVRAQLPQPDHVDHYRGSPPWESWCYDSGLELRVQEGRVIGVAVIRPSDC